MLRMLLFIIPVSLSTAAFGAGDPIAGKALAGICTDCHGEDGNSVITVTPKLAGQIEGYIVKRAVDLNQLHGEEDITSDVVNLKSRDLQNIAAYFAGQPVMKGASKNTEFMEKGQSLYFKERCYFCHTEGGKPTEKTLYAPPVIGGQHKEYLMQSMKLIQTGERRADVYDLMHQTLVGLAGEDLSAIAEFLSGL
jgi:cytochrome c553